MSSPAESLDRIGERIGPRIACDYRILCGLLVFSVLWVDLIRLLSFEWESNEQYSYGWFVPFLAAYLFWWRWRTRPAPSGTRCPAWGIPVVAAAVVGFLPLRAVAETNMDWPLIGWLISLEVVGISLFVVYLMGGVSWVKHCLFPIAFIMVAVPWPYRVEHGLTQTLMRTVAGLAVEILGIFKVPALQHGNLVEVGTGVVGINEACSGVRSLQSTLMAALALGELYFLRWPARLILIGAGMAMAFVFNIVRTSLLAFDASRSGIASVEKWHDSAGLSILLACFACLWACSIWLRKRAARPEEGRTELRAAPRAVPLAFLYGIGCWTIFSVAATEGWYRWHEARTDSKIDWGVEFPAELPSFKRIELSDESWGVLGCDSATTGAWTDEDGSQWQIFLLRWSKKSALSMMRARLHRPEICLPASGWHLVADRGIDRFSAGNLSLPFRSYIFEESGRPLHVFFCKWEGGGGRQFGLEGSKQGDRIRAVLMGRRRVEQQTLEIIIHGYETLELAEAAVRKRLPGLIHRGADWTSSLRKASDQQSSAEE